MFIFYLAFLFELPERKEAREFFQRVIWNVSWAVGLLKYTGMNCPMLLRFLQSQLATKDVPQE